MTVPDGSPRPRKPRAGAGLTLLEGVARMLLLGTSIGSGAIGLVAVLISRLVAVTLVGGETAITSDALFGTGMRQTLANYITVGLVGLGVLALAVSAVMFVAFVLEVSSDRRAGSR